MDACRPDGTVLSEREPARGSVIPPVECPVMAKTRKRRPSGPGPAMPTVAPATPGGPNRLARKEEARRQREALRRKMARRRGYRMVGLVVAFLLVAGAVSAYIVLKPSAAEA